MRRDMRQVALAFLFLLGFIGTVSGQDEGNSLKGVPASERVIFGGGMGLGFGSDQDYVMLSPSIGYLLTKKFMGGVNLTYQYTKIKYFTPSQTFNSFGGGPFLRYMVYRGIFLHAEYEYLNYEYYDTRRGYNSMNLGGGFIQPVGGNAAFYLLALYNVMYDTPAPGEYVPYSSPWVIRAGISLGSFGLF